MTAPEEQGDRGADLRARLDAAIMGVQPEYDSAQVADASGMTLADARRLWRALGFPDTGGSQAFTTDDIGALQRVLAAREAGLDMDTLVRMTRAVGSTMSRLADWEVSTILSGFDLDGSEGGEAIGLEERIETAIELVNSLSPSFELVMLYAWRRHLAAAVSRSEALQAHDEESHVATVTVGFADLVSFTALSNELGDQQIGDLVEVFETRCHDVIAGHGARIIKSLGDSVLFVADRAPDAIDVALDIIGVIGKDARLPDVRVGLATGPVVLRMGDVFGPAVNLAARLTTVARRNRVIIDHRTAHMLPPEDYETRTLPARPLRGFGDVEPVTVRATRTHRAG